MEYMQCAAMKSFATQNSNWNSQQPLGWGHCSSHCIATDTHQQQQQQRTFGLSWSRQIP